MADFVPAVKGWSEFEGVLAWLTTQDCEGCLASGGNPECPIRICAKERNLEGCWDCDEFPCGKLKEVKSAVESCRSIQEMGLEAWLSGMAAKVEAGFSYLEVLGKGE